VILRAAAAALAAIALLSVGLAYRSARPSRPDVLWISIDSLRPDRLASYGSGRVPTPFLDYLAAHGVLFDHAYADAPWTTAAMASALTGRFAVHHGLRTPFLRLPEDETTLAEVLADHGWRTAAIVGAVSLHRWYGLEQGFAHFDDRFDSPVEAAGDRPHLPLRNHDDIGRLRAQRTRKWRHDSFRADEAVTDAAVAWLQTAGRRRPVFLWVHFFGPHRRRQLGDTPAAAARRTLDSYDAAVARVDAQIGRLLDELRRSGRLANTLIVVQGDHGEALLEHGELDHGQYLYDATLRVPLLIAWPGRLAPRRSAAMVRVVDVAPTVLQLLHIHPPPGLDGMPLDVRADGGAAQPPPLLAETLLPAEASFGSFRPDGSLAAPGLRRLAVRTPRWKYVLTSPHALVNFPPEVTYRGDALPFGREELYDLVADPSEKTNLASQRPEIVQELRATLRAGVPDAATP